MRGGFVFGLITLIGFAFSNDALGDESASLWSVANGVIVNCQGMCSPSVAQFFNYEKQDKDTPNHSCTSFLVGPQIMATNNHCVGNLQAGDSCAEQASVTFPKVGDFQNEVHRCDKLLWRSDSTSPGNANDPRIDVAYFSIKDVTSRPILEKSSSGLQDGLKVRIFKIDPLSTKKGTIYRSTSGTCELSLNTVIFPFFDNPESVNVVLLPTGKSKCKLIEGNSGSPLVGEDGKFLAIAHTSHPPSQTQTSYPQIYAIVTNSYCMPNPQGTDHLVPQICLNDIDKDLRFLSSTNEEKIHMTNLLLVPQFHQAAKIWGEKNAPQFGWKMAPVDKSGDLADNLGMIPVPSCVNSSLKNSSMDMLIPLLAVTPNVDSKLHFKPNYRVAQNEKGKILIDENHVTFKVTFHIKDTDVTDTYVEEALPACAK